MTQFDGEASDTVPIRFSLDYGGADPVRVAAEFKLPAGDWAPMSRIDSAHFEQGDDFRIQWLSHVDLPHQDERGVLIRLQPFASLTGAAVISDSIHIDNNAPPVVTFVSADSLDAPLLGAADLSVRISDAEYDTLGVFCRAAVNPDSVYRIVAIPDSFLVLDSSRYSRTSLSWRYFPDQYGDSIPVRLLVHAYDRDTSQADTLDLLFRRLLGDFDANGVVALSDLDSLAIAWVNNEFSKNIGPYEGDIPFVKPVQDSAFDLEDLSAFILSWNWCRREFGDSAAPLARSRESIANTDRNLFIAETGGRLPVEKITMEFLSESTMVVTAPVAGDTLLTSGLLVRADGRVRIDSIQSGVRADFETAWYANDGGEALIYAANLSKSRAAPGVFRLYVTAGGISKSMRLDVFAHALLQNGKAENRAATIDLRALLPEFAFSRIYPNPLRNGAAIAFTLPWHGLVQFEILDLSGRTIFSSSSSRFFAGRHRVVWDGKASNGAPISSGFYLCRLSAVIAGKRYTDTRRLLIQK